MSPNSISGSHRTAPMTATFHAEFVKVLNSSAGAYLTTEVANAEQAFFNAVNAPARSVVASIASGAAIG